MRVQQQLLALAKLNDLQVLIRTDVERGYFVHVMNPAGDPYSDTVPRYSVVNVFKDDLYDALHYCLEFTKGYVRNRV